MFYFHILTPSIIEISKLDFDFSNFKNSSFEFFFAQGHIFIKN